MCREHLKMFCTAGRGTEVFTKEEITKKFGEAKVDITDGKVFFEVISSSDVGSQLLSMKTVERVFVEVLHKPHGIFRYKQKFAELRKLLEGIATWQKLISVWKRIREIQETAKSTVRKRNCSTSDTDVACIPNKRLKKSPSYSDDNAMDSPSEETGQETVTDGAGDDLTFRVSCRCTGRAGRLFQPQEFAKFMGVHLSRRYGWKVDLRHSALEINVHLSDSGICIGLPITNEPLSRRSYVKHIGLRSTVSYIMMSQACIQDSDRVLDPMCGMGTIIIEAGISNQMCDLILADHNDSQLQKAEENIHHAGLGARTTLFKADAKWLPLPSESIDVVICDLPFGQSHGTVEELTHEYPLLLKEMNRVLKAGGRTVLLTGASMKKTLVSMCKTVNTDVSEENVNTATEEKKEGSAQTGCDTLPWTLHKLHYLKLGDTHSYMCVITKDS